MKYLFLLLLLSSTAEAVVPIRERDFNTVALVTTQIVVRCDSTLTNNPDGTTTINTNVCVFHWIVGTDNTCLRASPYSFFQQMTGGSRSLHEVLMVAKGDWWTWPVGSPPPSVNADGVTLHPWCL